MESWAWAEFGVGCIGWSPGRPGCGCALLAALQGQQPGRRAGAAAVHSACWSFLAHLEPRRRLLPGELRSRLGPAPGTQVTFPVGSSLVTLS